MPVAFRLGRGAAGGRLRRRRPDRASGRGGRQDACSSSPSRGMSSSSAPADPAQCWPEYSRATKSRSTTPTSWRRRPITAIRCRGKSTRSGTSSGAPTAARAIRSVRCCWGRCLPPVGRRHGADRQVRGQDDRPRFAAGPRGLALAGRLVSRAGGEHLGRDVSDDHFRLWYHRSRAPSTPSDPAADPTHARGQLPGVLQQALRDLSAWVEKAWRPPASTSYQVVDGQVLVPPTAEERQGIQPVVTLTANGGERADVTVGEPVTFTAGNRGAAGPGGDRGRRVGFRRPRRLSD